MAVHNFIIQILIDFTEGRVLNSYIAQYCFYSESQQSILPCFAVILFNLREEHMGTSQKRWQIIRRIQFVNQNGPH